jgi:RimJ/RimL family protein N-acetyltransferase
MDSLEGVEIREGGLRLRPWTELDVDAVFEACQDPDIQRWTQVPTPYLREHAVGYVARSAQGLAEGSAAHLAVVDAGTDRVLGACGLMRREAGVGEIGYWTAPWARGRGVATAATRALCRWALGTLGLRRLQWRAEVGNHASRLVAARVGFRDEGLARQSLRHRDAYVDGWTAALLRGELLEEGQGPGSRATRRCKVFGGAQPTLPFTTRDGAAAAAAPRRPGRGGGRLPGSPLDRVHDRPRPVHRGRRRGVHPGLRAGGLGGRGGGGVRGGRRRRRAGRHDGAAAAR